MSGRTDTPLREEDWREPACLLRTCGTGERIPLGRIIEKLDLLLGREDAAGAERHLLYWEREAQAAGDLPGRSAVCGELAGFYRKSGETEKAKLFAGKAVSLLEEAGLDGTVQWATACLNAGTVFCAAGEYGTSVAFYEKALPAYSGLPENDPRKAGLFNNAALPLCALRRFDEAEKMLLEALKIASTVGKKDEEAITCLNLCDLLVSRDGVEGSAEEVSPLLDRAEKALSSPALPENGDTAFVFEKCAPVLDRFGRFAAAGELSSRAAAIREKLKR